MSLLGSLTQVGVARLALSQAINSMADGMTNMVSQIRTAVEAVRVLLAGVRQVQDVRAQRVVACECLSIGCEIGGVLARRR
jgi:isopentenyl diphosphate isomerase/L-lactate dehydrogenase-like FMN-dependent dehydrogenase